MKYQKLGKIGIFLYLIISHEKISKRIFFSRSNRMPTDVDHKSALIIQAGWRGYFVRHITLARQPGSYDNSIAFEGLKKTWAIVEQNLTENGLYLFR
jgi:hypothetical protein